MKIKKTGRGFGRIEFKDRDKNACSLQMSSLATTECIWLGMDEPEIKEFWPCPRETDEAWFDVNLDELKHRPQNEMHAFSRMHLTRKQVAKLLPHLQKFVEEGTIYLDN